VLDKVLDERALRRETRQLRVRVRDRVAPNNIVGISPPMQRVFEIVDQVAPSRATVLITGESGTGKELVANALHQRSPRANGPFIKLHCAALAESLLESELFGHEKGSFTGAAARKDGRFQLADGGTLFLDEIGEISPAIQVKLLRFLQEHEFERVGGNQTIRVDVRVIAATNRNLPEEVAKGRFREDLFYRLNVVGLEMPPLRDRRTDIPALAKFFLDRYAKENTKDIEGFTPETMDLLTAYDWPGNVRELENAIERSVVLTSGPLIEVRALPANIRPRLTPQGMPVIPGTTLADIEKYAILETLKSTGGSTSRAAELLGISVRTIQYRLHQYNEAPRSDVDVVQKPGSEDSAKT
jgi:two-component system, NtrC family, response regulator